MREDGAQAWFVGGCVRDLLLGRVPKDFDVATSATPDRIQRLFPDAKPVGAHFGVMLFEREGAQVEIATFRSDQSYSDGRRPDAVRFETSPEQDVLRRDFTINALLLDPLTGEVLDFVGGREDLEARLIRVIGDPERRFGEDHLRLLRAVRFAAVLGFQIEPATFAAIRRLAPLIRRVAAERIRDELERLLTEGDARRGLELLDESGLLVELLPEVAAMKGVSQPPQYHPEGDVWTHTLLMLGLMESHPPLTLALGVLLHDVGKPPTFRVAERIRFDGHDTLGARMAAEILGRLRFSKQQIRRVELLVADHLRFKDVPQMRPATLKRFLRQPHFEELLELHRLDCLASHRNLETYHLLLEMLRQTPPGALKPAPLLRGADLIQAGYTPGPLFGRILEAVEEAQLEGRLKTREQALRFVEHHFGPPAANPSGRAVGEDHEQDQNNDGENG
ncbi:MAG: CCA tRNA nucleotidyltransferase [Bryobacteraceae bacterium]|nr:CCA tRNA nucleotidyltransferase [Bryobacteraceae bacterium]